MIVLSPLFVFRPSMFCDGVLFPVVLVANAGPDMGHHGSFLTVCPLDQPDYSRNSQDLFQKNQKAVFLKDKTPNGDRIKIAFTNDVAVQLTLTYTYQKLKQVRQDSTSMVSKASQKPTKVCSG